MAYDPKRALELLRIGSGRADATFRDGQEDAIRHIVEGKGRLLVVQKTGWGKSFVYPESVTPIAADLESHRIHLHKGRFPVLAPDLSFNA